MNVILSLMLCLAMLLGGGSNLPAEPEVATTWAIRNAVLTLGGESVEIAPEARLTAAAGSERATLHFELASGGLTQLPISLDVTPDALRFALSGGGKGYNVSAAELEKLLSMSDAPLDAETLEILSDYIYGYGALMASMVHDPEGVRIHQDELTRLLFERCATYVEDTEVEIDGQSYTAQKFRLKSDYAMLDALRECDWPELSDFLDSTLALLNYSTGASAQSFEEFYTSPAGEQAAQAMGAMPELLVNVCETEDITYFGYDGMEFQSGTYPGFKLETRKAESLLYPGGASANVDMTIHVNDVLVEIRLNEEVKGDPYAPDSVNMTCDLRLTPEDESEELTAQLSFDGARDAEGKFSGALKLAPPADIDGAALPFDEVALAFAPGSEDGATSISLTATNGSEIFAGLGFEILRSEAAPVDYFDGAQMYEFTFDAAESDEASPLMMALFADVSQLSLDGMSLLQDPSIQAAGELIQRFNEELDARYSEMEDSGAEPAEEAMEEPAEETAEASESGGLRYLEDIKAVYKGEIPDYQPPEGYVLSRAQGRPDEISFYYVGDEGTGFCVNAYSNDESGALSYICEHGSATELTAPIAMVYPLEDGTFYSAYVSMPDGQYLSFEFDEALRPDELSKFLGGLTK